MAVIVEAPNQPRIDHISNAERVEAIADFGKIRDGFLGQMVREGRRRSDQTNVALVLRVENAQRISLQPLSAILRQRVAVLVEIFDQHLPVGIVARRVAEGVELKRRALLNAERAEKLRRESDDLDVGERLGNAKDLHVDLVKLPQPALLRPLVAEHRTAAEIFERQLLAQTAGNKGAGNARRGLRS